MGDTKIEWAEKTWNPVTGCTKISPGCEHCYAERMSKRLAGRCGYHEKLPFAVTLHPDKLDEPLRWREPSRIFVCSMGDLFHQDVPDRALHDVFHRISLSWKHRFLVLTKRPDRMKEFILDYFAFRSPSGDEEGVNPPANLWLGVTAENQEQADRRIPILLEIPAAKRFVSLEPMLGEVFLNRYLKWPICKTWNPSEGGNDHEYGKHHWQKQCLVGAGWTGLDQVICGGETGPGARPMHPEWARSLRDQCQAAGTAFFFKQWGSGAEMGSGLPGHPRKEAGYDFSNSKGGRILDGRTWDETPEVPHA